MLVSTLLLLCFYGAVADEPVLTDEQRNALPQHFGFGEMQIYKLKPNIRLLRVADLDGDGRKDLVVWNQTQSRIELFYQPEPGVSVELEETDDELNQIPSRGNFRRANVPCAFNIVALDVGDVSGDGRADLVAFTDSRDLAIMPGLADGGFGPAELIRAREGAPSNGALTLGDYNGDGRMDVAVRGDQALLVFLQRAEGGLANPIRLVHGIGTPELLLTGDLNGDGRDDLLISSSDERYGMYVSLQSPKGMLAALRPAVLPPFRSVTVVPPRAGEQGSDVYAIERATGRLKHYRWELPTTLRGVRDWPQQMHSYPIKGTSKRRPLALGDIGGDGFIDCVTADPDAAQLILFRGGAGGLGPAVTFPGLMKTNDIWAVDLDGDGQAEVLQASAEERMIGVSRFEDGRLTFPAPLATRGRPYVVTAGALRAGAPADQMAYVSRNEDDDYELVLRPLRGEGEVPETVLPIVDLDDEPAGVRFVDLDQDGRSDLLIFVRFNAPRAFLQQADGTFAALRGAETRDWLVKEAEPFGFATADVNGNGKLEVLFAQEKLARAMVVQNGQWTVVDQYNPEVADARIRGLAVLPGDDGQPVLVMYEQKGRDLLVFRQRADHTYAVAQSMPVGSFDLAAMLTLPIGHDGGRVGVVLADPDKLAVLVPDENAPTLVEKHTYETDSRDAWLADSAVGDLNGDGVRDLALLDWGKASLEIVTTLPDGGMVKAARFQVFQGRRFSRAPDSRAEPRELQVADVTGDGIADIVILVHDRLVVYPGQ
ncbi:MAG: VCBS repeat-containing protein [Phycisphaerales bacterium]|nr:VCBS repeat-containing protein [Phycisphaerales bacterium]